MEYFVAYELEGGIKEFNLLLREEISDKFGCKLLSVSPHIVLKNRFKRENISSVEEMLRTFSGSHRPVAFGMGGFNFSGGSVYVNIAPSNQMSSLSEDLLEEFVRLKCPLKREKEGRFRSIICEVDKKKVQEVVKFCVGQDVMYRGSLDGFTLFCLKDNVWESKNRYQLKGSTTGVVF